MGGREHGSPPENGTVLETPAILPSANGSIGGEPVPATFAGPLCLVRLFGTQEVNLEAKSFHRLGGVDEIRVDVQIIAATNRNLEEAVSAGRFRDDLYFRLKVIRLSPPPLSAHREDIPQLVDHFLRRLLRQYFQTIPTLSPATRQGRSAVSSWDPWVYRPGK